MNMGLSLVNRRRGQPGNRQLMPGLAERALRIIRDRYADFGPTLGWFMDPRHVTAASSASATTASDLHRRTHPD